MTDMFLTPNQIKTEFKQANVPDNWKPIVVIGKGGRERKPNSTIKLTRLPENKRNFKT